MRKAHGRAEAVAATGGSWLRSSGLPPQRGAPPWPEGVPAASPGGPLISPPRAAGGAVAIAAAKPLRHARLAAQSAAALLTLLLGEENLLIVTLTWMNAISEVIEFLYKSVSILLHDHDNYRLLVTTYFLIQITNIWMNRRFGEADFFSLATLFNVIFELSLLLYIAFEPVLHETFPPLLTTVER